MARQVLDNGVVLPSEYSDDWYDDMTSNLTKLDEVIGSDAEKLSASDVGDAAISNDYDDLSNLPGYGILRFCSTAITDNSSVAFANISSVSKIAAGDFLLDTAAKLYTVSAVDTSNETVSVTTPLTQLAVDSSVMHLSGNEDVNGTKTFKDMIPIDGDYLGNEASTNQRTNICLRSNRDTADKSGAFITRFRQDRTQGGLQPLDLQKIGFDVLENEVRTNNVFDIQCTDWLNDVPQKVNFVSNVSSYSYGRSSNKALINDLNPGVLSFPDLSSGLDISGYIDVSQVSQYTALTDGYISISCHANTTNVVCIKDTSYDFGTVIRAYQPSTVYETYAFIPVVKNHTYNISFSSTSTITLDYAQFFPCLGNV